MIRQRTAWTLVAAWMACCTVHSVEAQQWAQNMLSKFLRGRPQTILPSTSELAVKVDNFVPQAAQTVAEADQTIAGGTQVLNSRDYPFSVRLGDVGCTGTHIYSGIVLTSARCIINGLPRFVTIGATNDIDGKDVLVDTGYYYPDFINVYPYRNDIALIKLKMDGDSKLDDLPTVALADNPDYPEADIALTMIGYGRSATDDNQDFDLFKLQGFIVLPDFTCKDLWATKQSRGTIDPDLTFCAQSSGKTGGCSGDLGAPLLDSSNVQVGILSFVDTCGGEFPDAFTKVSNYANWVKSMLCSIKGAFCEKVEEPCSSDDGESLTKQGLSWIGRNFGY